MQSICLLVSGGLGYKILQQIFSSEHKLKAVFTNKKSTEIIDFCTKSRIPFYSGNPRNGKAQDFLSTFECDVVLSVNYLFIIEKDLIDKPKKYAINIHGSLLPKYRGRTPHVWAIINGEIETGITAHLIDDKLDNGQIIEQIKIPIHSSDTGANILEKFSEKYPTLVDSILEKINNGSLSFTPQDSIQASYFGKRTPEDGKINWQWSRERIYNWIRAQAKPYPGAFTFIEEQKIIIHRSEISDLGFRQEQNNGEVLSIEDENIFVKTNNGVIKVSELENGIPRNLIIGTILS